MSASIDPTPDPTRHDLTRNGPEPYRATQAQEPGAAQDWGGRTAAEPPGGIDPAGTQPASDSEPAEARASVFRSETASLDQDGPTRIRGGPRARRERTAPPCIPGFEVLRELGLLVEEKGKLRQAHALVKTPDQPLSHHVVRFHRVMMERAAEALDIVPREQREIASLTLCLSDAQLRALKAELAQMRGELLRKYGAEADAKRVVQLNFQMFPLSIEE